MSFVDSCSFLIGCHTFSSFSTPQHSVACTFILLNLLISLIFLVVLLPRYLIEQQSRKALQPYFPSIQAQWYFCLLIRESNFRRLWFFGLGLCLLFLGFWFWLLFFGSTKQSIHEIYYTLLQILTIIQSLRKKENTFCRQVHLLLMHLDRIQNVEGRFVPIQQQESAKLIQFEKQTFFGQIDSKGSRKLDMFKNKTHRIISISPNNKNQSALKACNKTITPIKQIQCNTRTTTIRTNTIKNSIRQQDIEALQSIEKRNIDNDHDCSNIEITSYRDSYPKERNLNGKQNIDNKSKETKNSFSIDQILNKIGKTYENNKSNNPSIQLMKKTQINYLRELLRQGKSILSLNESHTDQKLKKRQQNEKQSFEKKIRSQISLIFSKIHKNLYNIENRIYQDLDEKVFQLKEKNITKCYQMGSLKNYIDKCEKDINSNYEGIINDLDLSQFQKIVNSYTQKIEFYMKQVQIKHDLVIVNKEQLQTLQKINIGIDLVSSQQPTILNEPQLHSSYLPNTQMDKNLRLQLPKQTEKRRQGESLREVLFQIENVPLNQFINKKIKKVGDEPRISSARHKY